MIACLSYFPWRSGNKPDHPSSAQMQPDAGQIALWLNGRLARLVLMTLNWNSKHPGFFLLPKLFDTIHVSLQTDSWSPSISYIISLIVMHDDVIKWKHFPRYWPFVRGIHRPPVNTPHKYQWLEALMLSLICTRINSWVNNREAGDLRHHRAHYDVIVMSICLEVGYTSFHLYRLLHLFHQSVLGWVL